MEHLDEVKRLLKLPKFKKDLEQLRRSTMKHYKSSEDAKRSITFMNNAEEHYANPPPPKLPKTPITL